MTESLANGLRRLVERETPSATAVRVEGLTPLSGGNARTAWACDVHWRAGGATERRECVALVQARAGQLERALGPEFHTLAALDATETPTPAAYWIDADGSLLGEPGFVMQRVAGETSLRALLDPAHAASRGVALGMADAAAALHRVDPGAVAGVLPSSDAATVALEQVAEWEALFYAHRMEPLPTLAEAFRWLRRHAPAAGRLAIVHGDFRFGNVVYRGDALQSLLDWEMTHLGDPCEDLAWAYRALWSPVAHLSFEKFLARYREAGGPPYRDETLHFYRLFGEVKHAVISITGAHAFATGRSRNLRLADRMTWVPECIDQFVAWCPEFGPAERAG